MRRHLRGKVVFRGECCRWGNYGGGGGGPRQNTPSCSLSTSKTLSKVKDWLFCVPPGSTVHWLPATATQPLPGTLMSGRSRRTTWIRSDIVHKGAWAGAACGFSTCRGMRRTTALRHPFPVRRAEDTLTETQRMGRASSRGRPRGSVLVCAVSVRRVLAHTSVPSRFCSPSHFQSSNPLNQVRLFFFL